MKTLILLLLPVFAASQSRYSFAVTQCRTTGANISYAYGSILFGEAGLKTNGQEYYTMPYAGAGLQTTGKIYASISTGYGPILNIEQRDWPVVKEGYTVKALHCVYISGRIGYGNRLQVYAEYTRSGRDWVGVGVSLKSW